MHTVYSDVDFMDTTVWIPSPYYKTYITPVLLYGMELLLPSSKPLEQLEFFQKRILKHILSLPMSCPDPAVYILTGILPIEAPIHIKALTFFNNVCHQGEKKH